MQDVRVDTYASSNQSDSLPSEDAVGQSALLIDDCIDCKIIDQLIS